MSAAPHTCKAPTRSSAPFLMGSASSLLQRKPAFTAFPGISSECNSCHEAKSSPGEELLTGAGLDFAKIAISASGVPLRPQSAIGRNDDAAEEEADKSLKG
jgi:predicted CXXCH cytochrome family protein